MQAVNSLSHFAAAPRTQHLQLLTHVFGYLRQFPKHTLEVTTEPLIPHGQVTKPYTTKDGNPSLLVYTLILTMLITNGIDVL
jgi:hypothetical protein